MNTMRGFKLCLKRVPKRGFKPSFKQGFKPGLKPCLKPCLQRNSLKKETPHDLEKNLLDEGPRIGPQIFNEAVKQRRRWYQRTRPFLDLSNIPYRDYNYEKIWERNCENVIGYVRVPVGIVDSVLINGKLFDIPLATTEGSLISSLNRGAKVIRHNGTKYGIQTQVTDVGMTRAPILQFPSLQSAVKFRKYVEQDLDRDRDIGGKGVPRELLRAFSATTRHGKLQSITAHQLGRKIHLRIVATTGEAMGMNIITQGAEAVVREILKNFPGAKCLSISGNMCTDKKPNAVNLILGRGKHAIAETEIPRTTLRKILRVEPETLIDLNTEKNYLGSALAGSIGGQNAHLANVVSGIYLATGQDLGHIGTSSLGITEYQYNPDSEALRVTLTMPCMELGTVGGGTHLEDQKALLKTALGEAKMLSETYPPSATRSEDLASVCVAACLIGEISLMSALANNELMNAHLRLNRK